MGEETEQCVVDISDALEKLNLSLSDINFIGELKNQPEWEVALKLTIYAIIILLSLIGNFTMIALILFKKYLRTITNYFIINLTVAELIITFFALWVHPVDDVTQGWVLGPFVCEVNTFISVASMSASSFTHLTISVDRFCAIMFPMCRRKIQSARVCFVVIMAIWTAAIAISLPLAIVYKYEERQWKDHLEIICTDIWPGCSPEQRDFAKRLYWTIFSVVVYALVIVVTSVLYALAIVKLSTNKVGDGNIASISTCNRTKIKARTIRVLCTIFLVFLICLLPFVISKMYELYRPNRESPLPTWYSHFYFFSLVLAHANSAINPILFGWMNTKFRNAFLESINHKIPQCCSSASSEEVTTQQPTTSRQITTIQRPTTDLQPNEITRPIRIRRVTVVPRQATLKSEK